MKCKVSKNKDISNPLKEVRSLIDNIRDIKTIKLSDKSSKLIRIFAFMRFLIIIKQLIKISLLFNKSHTGSFTKLSRNLIQSIENRIILAFSRFKLSNYLHTCRHILFIKDYCIFKNLLAELITIFLHQEIVSGRFKELRFIIFNTILLKTIPSSLDDSIILDIIRHIISFNEMTELDHSISNAITIDIFDK